MGKFSIIKEFWQFLMANKKWWLIPIFIVLFMVGLLIFLTAQSQTVVPFIYTLF